jgi:hypothetical protein
MPVKKTPRLETSPGSDAGNAGTLFTGRTSLILGQLWDRVNFFVCCGINTLEILCFGLRHFKKKIAKTMKTGNIQNM